MVTINPELEKLTKADVIYISDRYLRGWCNLRDPYKIRLQGLNNKRKKYGFPPLDFNMSVDYRVNYIESHYSYDEIHAALKNFMETNIISDCIHYDGFNLLGCHFRKDYRKVFKRLLGSSEYKKLSQKTASKKSIDKQVTLYGGSGLAGSRTQQRARNTVKQRYGVSNVMHVSEVVDKLGETNTKIYGSRSPFGNLRVRKKAMDVKSKRLQKLLDEFLTDGHPGGKQRISIYEFTVAQELIKIFGKDDIVYQYGTYPYDARYPYMCDFYIKSLDLFIEINVHPSHGGHWFDENDHRDQNKVKQLKEYIESVKSTPKQACMQKDILNCWTVKDVHKRNLARKNKLNYLVFWDRLLINGVPRLEDFYTWLYDYNADVEKFSLDNPQCTY